MRRRLAGVATAGGLLVLVVLTLLMAGGSAQAKAPGPNGRIAFVRVLNGVAVETPQRAAFTINPDGTHPKRLPVGTSPDPAPLWSPDGSEILVGVEPCPSGGDCGQLIVNPDDGSFRELPEPDAFSCAPAGDCGNTFFGCHAWSPNGNRLACDGSSDEHPGATGIYTVRSSDGGGLTLVTHKFGVLGDYSPDGTRLVFEAEDGSGGFGLFVILLDGSGLHQITPAGMLLNSGLSDGGSWSPSGNKIAFWAQSDEDHRFSIWMVKADGSHLHRVRIPGCGGLLTDPETVGCRRPSWSPDGAMIVFERGPLGASDIYTANADGSGLSAVAHAGLDEGVPDWGSHPLTP
jgi:hypothetical protein